MCKLKLGTSTPTQTQEVNSLAYFQLFEIFFGLLLCFVVVFVFVVVTLTFLLICFLFVLFLLLLCNNFLIRVLCCFLL